MRGNSPLKQISLAAPSSTLLERVLISFRMIWTRKDTSGKGRLRIVVGDSLFTETGVTARSSINRTIAATTLWSCSLRTFQVVFQVPPRL